MPHYTAFEGYSVIYLTNSRSLNALDLLRSLCVCGWSGSSFFYACCGDVVLCVGRVNHMFRSGVSYVEYRNRHSRRDVKIIYSVNGKKKFDTGYDLFDACRSPRLASSYRIRVQKVCA